MSIQRFWRASAWSRGTCTAHLSPWEKELLFCFSTNGKVSIYVVFLWLYFAHS